MRLELYGGNSPINIAGSVVKAGALSLALVNVFEFSGASGALNEALTGDARGINIFRNPYWDYYYHFQTIDTWIERR